MRIAVDISQIVYEGTGSARYEYDLLSAVYQYSPTITDWTFFLSSFRRNIPERVQTILDKVHTKQLPVPPKLLHFIWNDLHILPIHWFIGKQDWVITSDWTQPPSGGRKMATIVHDLAFLRYPEVVPPQIQHAQRKRLEWAKKESQLFITLSQATKTDLIELLKIPEQKVQVLYPAVDIQFPTLHHQKAVQQKFSITYPFILSVGKIEPRKNIKRLIEAYTKLETEAHLIIVGPPGWEALSTKHEKIHFTGFVSDEELSALYSLAECFVMPSVWEGFGYPVVEAMKLGCPTLVSNTSSLKEIGEGASELFNPLEVDSIKDALTRVLQNPQLRSSLKQRGLEKSQLFSLKNYYNNLKLILS